MKKLTALLAGLFFILVAAVPAGEGSEDYIIGPRDVLNLVVWGEENMSEKVEVASDGTIPFFYVGKVKVAGLSVSQAHDRLVGLLADGYIRNPVVILKVEEFHSKEVQIQGAISKPGTYILTTNDTTLLKLISMAGGTSDDHGNWAFVTRGDVWRELERAKAAATPAPASGSTVVLPASGPTVGPAAGSTAFGWTAPAAGAPRPAPAAPAAAPVAPAAPAATVPPAPRKPARPSIWTDAKPPVAPAPPAPAKPPVLPPAPPDLTPHGSDTTQVIVDLRGLLDRGDYSQDVVIYPGDFVYIGSIKVENLANNYIFVGGAVRDPQQVQFTEGMTALQAVIKAGGFTEVASPNRTTITRTGANGAPPVVIRIRLRDIQRGRTADVPLQAGDRINVPESAF